MIICFSLDQRKGQTYTKEYIEKYCKIVVLEKNSPLASFFPDVAQFIAKWKGEVEPSGGRVFFVSEHKVHLDRSFLSSGVEIR